MIGYEISIIKKNLEINILQSAKILRLVGCSVCVFFVFFFLSFVNFMPIIKMFCLN